MDPTLVEQITDTLQGYPLQPGRAVELAAELQAFLVDLEPRAMALGVDAEAPDFLALLEELAPEVRP